MPGVAVATCLLLLAAAGASARTAGGAGADGLRSMRAARHAHQELLLLQHQGLLPLQRQAGSSRLVDATGFEGGAAAAAEEEGDEVAAAAAAEVAEPLARADVPPVFTNGAWDPVQPGALNAYVAALLSKDIYFKHMVGPHANRSDTDLFATLFCDSMTGLGADECEVVQGPESLVYAVVRAGVSVLLVIRGSNTPQNWIADVTSLRTTNVGDFGGGTAGTNVALGFYNVFLANRRGLMDRVARSMASAAAAAAAAAAAQPEAAAEAAGGGPQLWVVGHSLGGAVALMAAAYLHLHEGLAATGVYTFGCPRVGDTAWARAYPLQAATVRVENAGDIVPTLPFGSAWRHVGAALPVRACGPLAAAAAATTAAAATAAAATGAGAVSAVATAAASEGGAGGAEEAAGGDGWAAALARAAAADAEAGREGAGEVGAMPARRALRSAGAGAAAVGVGSGGGGAQAVEAVGAVAFPFPFVVEDHMIQTYVKVMWSCLPGSQQRLAPGPEDPYAA